MAEPSGVIFRPEFVDLLDGDHVSALMLSQIVYWWTPAKNGKSRLRAVMRGKPCLVKSHQDWWNELRLTRRQTNRCLDVLRAKNFVVTEVHRWQSKPTVHLVLQVSVLGLALSQLHSGVHLVCTPACTPIAPAGANPMHVDVQPQTEITTETTTQITNAIACGIAEQPEDLNMATAKEILENMKNKPAPTGKLGLNALVFQWKKQVGLTGDGTFVKPLTMKEIGQLKQVLAHAGDQAFDLLAFVFENWQKFANEAQMTKGLSGVSLVPNPGFLLTHVDTAMNLLNAKPEVVVAVQPIAVKVDTPAIPPDTPDLATEEDVQATLAALKALKGSS